MRSGHSRRRAGLGHRRVRSRGSWHRDMRRRHVRRRRGRRDAAVFEQVVVDLHRLLRLVRRHRAGNHLTGHKGAPTRDDGIDGHDRAANSDTVNVDARGLVKVEDAVETLERVQVGVGDSRRSAGNVEDNRGF